MKKRLIFILIFCQFIFSQIACGQTILNLSHKQELQSKSDKKLENLKKQARDFYQAQIDEDAKTLSKFIYYPKFLKEPPVQEKEYRDRNVKNYIEGVGSIKTLKSAGINVEIKKVEEPSQIVEEGNQLLSTVLIDLLWITEEGKCVVTVCALGISQDKGDNWEFFNGNCKDDTFPKRIGFYFPEAVKKMTFPKWSPPECNQ